MVYCQQKLLQFPPVYGLSYFELTDLNNDGHTDLLLSNGDNADHSIVLKPYHGIRIFMNDGKNNFKKVFFYPMHGASKAMAHNFDQDGDLDIAAISFPPNFKNPTETGFVYLQQDSFLSFNAKTFPASNLGHWSPWILVIWTKMETQILSSVRLFSPQRLLPNKAYGYNKAQVQLFCRTTGYTIYPQLPQKPLKTSSSPA